jgi:predicted enzyme related to lactoylglutathione lyase
MNLNSILIGSEDPQRLTEYYTRLFGEPGWSGEDFRGWQLGSGYVTVGPHDRVRGPNPQPGRLIWNLEASDVHGEFERLKAAGAAVVQEPYQPDEDPEGWIATFADPDDNYFQLVSRTRGSAPMDERHTRVSELLHEAAETHHRVFRITDGADDDWASWYAQWLVTLSELPELLGAKVVRSELTYLLVRLDKEYTERRPDQRWEDYYAQELRRHFSPG